MESNEHLTKKSDVKWNSSNESKVHGLWNSYIRPFTWQYSCKLDNFFLAFTCKLDTETYPTFVQAKVTK
jgi:hypothetical protein